MTTPAIFISSGGPQAHDNSLEGAEELLKRLMTVLATHRHYCPPKVMLFGSPPICFIELVTLGIQFAHPAVQYFDAINSTVLYPLLM